METITRLLSESEKYWAHISPKGTSCDPESLEEHSSLVLKYTNSLVEGFSVNTCIEKLIRGCIQGDNPILVQKLVKLFSASIYYHDLGKINPNFQNKKMNNGYFQSGNFQFDSDHSLPGYMLFTQKYISEADLIEDEGDAEIFTLFVFLVGFQICKHHAPYLDDLISYFRRKFSDSDDEIASYMNHVRKLFEVLNFNEHEECGLDIFYNLEEILKDFFEDENLNPFPLFALLKLHYSLLTASDYLATTHYMNQWTESLSDFGTINDNLRQKIIKNVRTSKEYNKKVFDVIDNYQFSYPKEQSNQNLNILRKELSIEVIQNIKKNTNKKVFYIEAPTGAGKTNLSMLATAELLQQNKEINNIYYVFPFTTLITQTYDALKETMGLDEDEIIQMHSKEGFKEKSDGVYGKDKKNHIDYLFLNYPVALLSHIKFFDILKSNSKEKNYLLHRLANSVVVIDELQSYPPKMWDKIIYLIQNYAEYFDIRFILMSATLPKLDKLSNVAENICYLTNNKEEFFQNPNFCNRVEFDFSLLDWAIPEKDEKNKYLNRLGGFVVEKSREYCNNNDKYPNSVFMIIEFIYKQTATEFYSVIETLSEGFYDQIFVLSGTILEPRRKEIIHYLKNPENRDKKVILITTQVVEAGVDIDMDLGFKDKSIVDSDEQLAGRINRNVNKSACKLYLFNCDSAEVIYKGDERFQLLSSELCGLDRKILKNKDFDCLYVRVMQKIDKQNDRRFQVGFSDFESALQNLNFPLVDQSFKIINQQSSSVFVPMDLPVFVPDTSNRIRNFTEKEMGLLVKYGIATINDHVVSGEKVFDLYERIIKQDTDDFVSKKTELKKLQGIMSQFIFSLMAHSKSMDLLLSNVHGEERMGIFYLSHWRGDETYDYHFGLIEKDAAAIIL